MDRTGLVDCDRIVKNTKIVRLNVACVTAQQSMNYTYCNNLKTLPECLTNDHHGHSSTHCHTHTCFLTNITKPFTLLIGSIVNWFSNVLISGGQTTVSIHSVNARQQMDLYKTQWREAEFSVDDLSCIEKASCHFGPSCATLKKQHAT